MVCLYEIVNEEIIDILKKKKSKEGPRPGDKGLTKVPATQEAELEGSKITASLGNRASSSKSTCAAETVLK